jgi:hypothetical protein
VDSSSTDDVVGCSIAKDILGEQIVNVVSNTENCAGFKKMSAKEFSYMTITRKSLVN